MDRYTQFAMAAAKQVVEGAGDLSGIDPFRAGVIVGSGIGGFQTTLAEHQKFLEKGPDRVSVFMVPMMISNMAAGQDCDRIRLQGGQLRGGHRLRDRLPFDRPRRSARSSTVISTWRSRAARRRRSPRSRSRDFPT